MLTFSFYIPGVYWYTCRQSGDHGSKYRIEVFVPGRLDMLPYIEEP
jgi:hypothetical protein